MNALNINKLDVELLNGLFLIHGFGKPLAIIKPVNEKLLFSTIYVIGHSLCGQFLNIAGFFPNKHLKSQKHISMFRDEVLQAFSIQEKESDIRFQFWLDNANKNYESEWYVISFDEFMMKYNLLDMRVIHEKLCHVDSHDFSFACTQFLENITQNPKKKKLGQLGYYAENTTGNEAGAGIHQYMPADDYFTYIPEILRMLKNNLEDLKNVSLYKLITDQETIVVPMDVENKAYKFSFRYNVESLDPYGNPTLGRYIAQACLYNKSCRAFIIVELDLGSIQIGQKDSFKIAEFPAKLQLNEHNKWVKVYGNTLGLDFNPDDNLPVELQKTYYTVFHEILLLKAAKVSN